MKLEFPLSVIRILEPFAYQNDTRPSLYGVAISEGCAVATDGHRLAYCESPEIMARDFETPARDLPFIIPGSLAAFKVSRKDAARVVVRIEGETAAGAIASLGARDDSAEDRAIASRLPALRIGGCVTFCDYPEWRRLERTEATNVPDDVPPMFDPRYVASFADAAVAAGAFLGTVPSIRIFQRVQSWQNAARLDLGTGDRGTFRGLLMPLRG